MGKKINIFLTVLAVALLIFGIVLVCKPIAYKEIYISDRNANSSPLTLQFYDCGIVKVNSTSQFYEFKEDITGQKIIKISYDELKVINFYKIEYTRWDVENQSDITTYLTCSSRLVTVILIFVVDVGIIIYIIYSIAKNRKTKQEPSQNNN